MVEIEAAMLFLPRIWLCCLKVCEGCLESAHKRLSEVLDPVARMLQCPLPEKICWVCICTHRTETSSLPAEMPWTAILTWDHKASGCQSLTSSSIGGCKPLSITALHCSGLVTNAVDSIGKGALESVWNRLLGDWGGLPCCMSHPSLCCWRALPAICLCMRHRHWCRSLMLSCTNMSLFNPCISISMNILQGVRFSQELSARSFEVMLGTRLWFVLICSAAAHPLSAAGLVVVELD